MERRESSWGFEDLPGMEDGGAEGLVLKVDVQVLWNCSNCLVPTASKWWSFLTKHANAHLWMVLLVFQFFPMPWFDVALRFLLGAGIGETMLVMDFGRFVQRPCPPQPPRMQNTKKIEETIKAMMSHLVLWYSNIFTDIQWYEGLRDVACLKQWVHGFEARTRRYNTTHDSLRTRHVLVMQAMCRMEPWEVGYGLRVEIALPACGKFQTQQCEAIATCFVTSTSKQNVTMYCCYGWMCLDLIFVHFRTLGNFVECCIST